MRVYHFCHADHAISNISLRRIKVSRFYDLNDPFELLAGESKDNESRRAHHKFKDDFDKVRGLLCFSKRWSNPVLWSHYADKHRGICLGFDLAETHAVPVKYQNDRVKYRPSDIVYYNGISSYVLDLVRTKYVHWQYEEEIRAIVELEEEGVIDNGLYFFPLSEVLVLKEVILGALSEIDYQAFKQFLKKLYPDVKLRVARLSSDSYEVVDKS